MYQYNVNQPNDGQRIEDEERIESGEDPKFPNPDSKEDIFIKNFIYFHALYLIAYLFSGGPAPLLGRPRHRGAGAAGPREPQLRRQADPPVPLLKPDWRAGHERRQRQRRHRGHRETDLHPSP